MGFKNVVEIRGVLQVDAVFQINDSDKDGKLNLEEFQDFMSHKNQPLPQ